MAHPNPSAGKTRLIFAGAIAAVVVLTLGVAARGIYRSAGDAGADGKKLPVAAAAPTPARPSAPSSAGASVAGGVSGPAGKAPAGPQSVPEAFRVKRVLPIKGPFRHGDYVWDDKGVPAGPIVITIDLKAQTLSVFRDGYEIGAAVILYGATDKPSPEGVFPILQKDADHYSSTYDNAPMPFTLRLTNDGVAIHGADVVWGNATHGCIGVPTPFARKLFGVTKRGDPVIITNGKMMQTH